MSSSQIEVKAPKRQSKKEKEAAAQSLKDFISTALERFHLAEEAESVSRNKAVDDFEFSIGEQWSPDIQTQRVVEGRPCLTMDRIQPAIQQVANEQRQQRPGAQINPVGSGGDVETAKILQGMIRHIEVNSDAEIVYDTAFDHMLRGGFGWWRIVTEYVDDKSWDQELKLKWVKNPFTVHIDPFAQEPDYSDAEWGFIWDDIPYEVYKRKYPGSEVASITDFGNLGDVPADWLSKQTVRVADYFHVEYEKHKLSLLDDGSVAWDGEIIDGSQARVVREREIQVRKVVWTKMNAVEKLEETDWMGKWIPIIPVNGIDIVVNGKRYLAGLVRNCKEPQRMYNYFCSSATEAVALAPKAPWVVAEGQIAGYEKQWEQSNTRTQAVLPYKLVDIGGKPAPPPQRINVEPPIQAMVAMMQQAGGDFQQATGIFPPALGENPKDQSGVAIKLLQRRSDVGQINWTDNLSRSIRFSTRQLLDLIPHIYDTPRIQRIINPDNSVDHVGIFNSKKPLPEGVDAKAMLMQQGMKKVFDIGVGSYDVTISVGPSYQTKRQEAVASIMALVSAYPQIMQIAGDILVSNMDWNQAEEIADRLKKALPPGMLDTPGDDATPDQLKAHVAQLTAQNAQLTQLVRQGNQVIQTKAVEGQNKLDVAKLNADKEVMLRLIDERVRLAVAQITASKDANEAMGDRMFAEMEMAAGHAHDVAMQATQQQHEQDMAQQQAAVAAQQAQQQPQGATQ